MDLHTLEAEILKLSPKERAAIIYKLLESLESDKSDNIEEIWVNEAIARYYQLSNDEVIDSDSVIKEAKLKYR
jgi:Putative addiction module component